MIYFLNNSIYNIQSVENKIDGLVVVFTGLVSSGEIVLVSFGQSLANKENSLDDHVQKEFVALVFGKCETEAMEQLATIQHVGLIDFVNECITDFLKKSRVVYLAFSHGITDLRRKFH